MTLGFDIKKISFYTVSMFVAVICDIADAGHRDMVVDYLMRYGFSEIIDNTFETTSISEKALLRLKRDIDQSTDFYDKIRFYQYPFEDTMVISFLKEKKWKKSVIRT